MVQFDDIRAAKATLFLPPYGDGTGVHWCGQELSPFSPPYGDGTIKERLRDGEIGFSTPYGDGTQNAAPEVVKS